MPNSPELTIDSLKENNLILLECLAGSRAYGLATPESDTDIKGVYYLPKERFYGLTSDYVPQVSNATNDIVYYELGRYIDLLLQNNPNMLEVLATPDDKVLYRHPIMDNFKPEWFISKLAHTTFAGFANSQIKKARGLNKKIVNPMEKERKTILDFCTVFQNNQSIPLTKWLADNGINQRELGVTVMPKATQMYALYYAKNSNNKDSNDKDSDDRDAKSNRSNETVLAGLMQKDDATQLKLSSVSKNAVPIGYLSFNQVGFTRYCRAYNDYWQWVEQRNQARYDATMNHGKQYDAKNMMHTIRLLQMTLDIATTGQIIIERPNRDELLAIKAGQSDYDDLLEYAERLNKEIDDAFASSSLRETPDRDKALEALIDARDWLYK